MTSLRQSKSDRPFTCAGFTITFADYRSSPINFPTVITTVAGALYLYSNPPIRVVMLVVVFTSQSIARILAKGYVIAGWRIVSVTEYTTGDAGMAENQRKTENSQHKTWLVAANLVMVCCGLCGASLLGNLGIICAAFPCTIYCYKREYMGIYGSNSFSKFCYRLTELRRQHANVDIRNFIFVPTPRLQ